MSTTLYIAGPMSGLPDHNYPAFRDAASVLTKAGYSILNPAENEKKRTDATQKAIGKAARHATQEGRCSSVTIAWSRTAGGPSTTRSRGSRAAVARRESPHDRRRSPPPAPLSYHRRMALSA